MSEKEILIYKDGRTEIRKIAYNEETISKFMNDIRSLGEVYPYYRENIKIKDELKQAQQSDQYQINIDHYTPNHGFFYKYIENFKNGKKLYKKIKRFGTVSGTIQETPYIFYLLKDTIELQTEPEDFPRLNLTYLDNWTTLTGYCPSFNQNNPTKLNSKSLDKNLDIPKRELVISEFMNHLILYPETISKMGRTSVQKKYNYESLNRFNEISKTNEQYINTAKGNTKILKKYNIPIRV